jgi:modification methylase
MQIETKENSAMVHRVEPIILAGDCRQVLPQLKREHFDLVFADPPYFMQLDESAENGLDRGDGSKAMSVIEDWDKFKDLAEYDQFTRAWLSECLALLKPDGAIWITGTYHNIFRVGSILQDLGGWILNDVIWRKPNPMPNFRGTRLTNSHETMIWAVKSRDSKYVFNRSVVKEGLESTRDEWTIPVCKGSERLRDENGESLHPTQKPISLLRRILMVSTKVGDLVLDPFSGTGTTGAAAVEMGREFIGIEAYEPYRQASLKRLEKVSTTLMPIEEINHDGIERAGMLDLIDAGLLSVRERLLPVRDNGVAWHIGQDGRLISPSGNPGSIHKIASQITGSSANGWTFWSVIRNQRRVPLDHLRSAYLKQPVPDDESQAELKM